MLCYLQPSAEALEQLEKWTVKNADCKEAAESASEQLKTDNPDGNSLLRKLVPLLYSCSYLSRLLWSCWQHSLHFTLFMSSLFQWVNVFVVAYHVWFGFFWNMTLLTLNWRSSTLLVVVYKSVLNLFPTIPSQDGKTSNVRTEITRCATIGDLILSLFRIPHSLMALFYGGDFMLFSTARLVLR